MDKLDEIIDRHCESEPLRYEVSVPIPHEIRSYSGVPSACGRKCLACNEPVYHAFPWWDKDPQKHADARPIHDDCWKALD